jgi:hypothetical protein
MCGIAFVKPQGTLLVVVKMMRNDELWLWKKMDMTTFHMYHCEKFRANT